MEFALIVPKKEHNHQQVMNRNVAELRTHELGPDSFEILLRDKLSPLTYGLTNSPVFSPFFSTVRKGYRQTGGLWVLQAVSRS